MEVREIRWQRVKVPFREPLATASGTIRDRYSLLLWLDTDQGITGLGEAPSSLAEGEKGLERLSSTMGQTAPGLADSPFEGLITALDNLEAVASQAPALRFGLETAALDALGRGKGKPIAALLGGQPQRVPLNAVIGEGSTEETRARASQAVAQGFRTIKLKVGGRDQKEDLRTLRAVRAAVGSKIALRLDANQAWPPAEAIVALSRLAPFNPEYIEEPVALGDPATLARVRSASSIPIAVDESLETMADAIAVIEAKAADVLVVKAARIGGLRRTKEIVDLAKNHGLKAVVTSSLETGVGLASSLHLAAALGLQDACGLATGHLLEHDLLTTPLLPIRGFLAPSELPGLGVEIDASALKRYSIGSERRVKGQTAG